MLEVFFRGITVEFDSPPSCEEMLQYLLENPSVEYFDHVFLEEIPEEWELLAMIRNKPYSLIYDDEGKPDSYEADGVNATTSFEDAKSFQFQGYVVEFEGESQGINLFGDGWVVRPIRVLKITKILPSKKSV